MLGSQTQFPTDTGLEQLKPQAAGARLTFAHESAYATPVRASIAITAIAARIALLIRLPFTVDVPTGRAFDRVRP